MAAQQNWIKVLDTIEVQDDSTNPVPNIQIYKHAKIKLWWRQNSKDDN
mgnify:CR=1 FL=1